MNQRARIFTMVAAAIAIAAYARRPVKPPKTDGAWQPADDRRTRR